MLPNVSPLPCIWPPHLSQQIMTGGHANQKKQINNVYAYFTRWNQDAGRNPVGHFEFVGRFLCSRCLHLLNYDYTYSKIPHVKQNITKTFEFSTKDIRQLLIPYFDQSWDCIYIHFYRCVCAVQSLCDLNIIGSKVALPFPLPVTLRQLHRKIWEILQKSDKSRCLRHRVSKSLFHP